MIGRSVSTLVLLSCVALQGCGQTVRRHPASPPSPPAHPPATETPAQAPVEATSSAGNETDVPAHKQRLQSSDLAMEQQAVGYFMDVQQARLTQVGGDRLTLQRDGNQRIILSLPGALTFEVGSAELSERGQQSLLQVAAILAELGAAQHGTGGNS